MRLQPRECPLGVRISAVFACSLLLLAGVAWSADKEQSDIDKRIDTAAKVLDEIMATPDKAIPDKIMSGAKCVAVVPSMVKIAVGFGGITAKAWLRAARLRDGGAPWHLSRSRVEAEGLQLGGQAVDLVMIVTNDEGMQHLLSSKFKIGADASAAAGPVGRDAAAGTDWKMKSQLLTYSRARGLFAGIDLSGSAVTQDKDETQLMYGKFVPFGDILEGKVRRTSSSRPFLSALTKYAGGAGPDAGQTVASRKTGRNNPVAHAKIVTGCLQSGTQPNEFAISDKDGKMWSLDSQTVKLDEHIGHQVTITGIPVRDTMARTKGGIKEGQVEQASSTERFGDLRVTAVRMISAKCEQ